MRLVTLATLFALALPVSAAPATVAYQDLSGVAPQRQLLDIYPVTGEATAPAPVLVWVHGGAWRFGNKGHVAEKKAAALAQKGIMLVAINYRFHPQVDFKAQAADVATALKWVQENISRYGGDPKKIAVMGHSAGAHLAALATIDHKYLKKAGVDLKAIRAVILLDGAGYDIPLHLSTGSNRETRIYTTVFTGDENTQREASPVSHVRKGSRYPEFLIIPVARRESTRLQSKNLAAKLTAAGAKATVHVAPGKSHMTLNREWGDPGDAPTEVCLEFLEKAFASR